MRFPDEWTVDYLAMPSSSTISIKIKGATEFTLLRELTFKTMRVCTEKTYSRGA
jgi:hypothetical protein